MEKTPPPPGQLDAGYETTDFRSRPVVTFGIGILVLVGASFIFLIGVMLLLERLNPVGQPISPIATSQLPPSPRLEIEEGGDLGEALRKANAVLNHYGWVDQPAGKVRIPIDRAIDLLAERGLPSRAAAPPVKQEAAK